MILFWGLQLIWTKKDLDEEKKEEEQERKLALEKNQRKRKNLDLDKSKNPHHNDGGFVLKAGLEPARILLSIGF